MILSAPPYGPKNTVLRFCLIY